MLRLRCGSFLSCTALCFAVSVSAQTFSQQGGKLVGSGSVPNDTYFEQGAEQGASVALSSDGNTALIGAPYDNSGTGAVWVLVRSGTFGVWSQQGSKLVGSGATNNNLGFATGTSFGDSVALSADGNTALIGGPGLNNGAGAAWIFTRANGTWTQQGSSLVGTGAVNSQGGANQGSSVALSSDGNTALIGAPADNNRAGAAWVFTRANGVWTQQGSKLVGSGAVNSPNGAAQGASIALSGDGNTALVAGPSDNNGAGATWVFTRGGNGQWTQQGSKLVTAVGANTNDELAISADGTTFVVGSPGNGALVFTQSNGIWSQQGNALVGTGQVGFAYQATSVALSSDGNTALTGAPGDANMGAAWAFTRDSNGNWTQLGSKLVGTGASQASSQGAAVALSGDGSTALLGGPTDSSTSTNLGAAWPFVRTNPVFSWIPGSLTQISVGADGSVWGINEFHQIYSYDLSTASWTSISGSLSQISVGSSTAVWGINENQQIYHWDSVHSKWLQIPGSLVQIAVGADGDVWGLNDQSSIYHYNAQGSYFAEVKGTLKQIAVGSAGAVYGLYEDGGIYWYNPGTGAFQLLANTNGAGFTQISVGVDGDLWAVKGDVAYHYDVLHNSMDATPGSIAQLAVGYGAAVFGLNAEQQIYEWSASAGSWTEIPGALTSIAVGANGSVWGINSAQDIYRFGGATRQFQTLLQIPGSLTQISVGVDGSVWGLNSGNVEYFNSGTQSFETLTTAPPLTQLSVGAGADVWGVDASGNIYQYDATTATWNTIPGELNLIQVGADGSVWGINLASQIYTYDFNDSAWVNIPGSLKTLSVGADGAVWGVNAQQQIYNFVSPQSWAQSPGALTQVAVGSAANVWGINAQNEVFHLASGTQPWLRVPVLSLTNIAAAFDGSVLGVDSAGNLYEGSAQTLTNIGGAITGSLVTNASIGNAAAVWAINTQSGTVFLWF